MRKLLLFILTILTIVTLSVVVFGFFQSRSQQEKASGDLIRKVKAIAESADLATQNILKNDDPLLAKKLAGCFEKFTGSSDHRNFSEGKDVIEIRPTGGRSKGWAAKKVMSQYDNYLPVCIGNDITDEDMFGSFKGVGTNVRVGKYFNSKAEYYVENVDEAQHFLDCVFDLKNTNIKL